MDEGKPVAVLAAEKCVYNLTCPRRVAVRLERIVRVHCVKSARQLVDVGLNDVAVVHRNWRVSDDLVVHWFGLVYRVKRLRVGEPRPSVG